MACILIDSTCFLPASSCFLSRGFETHRRLNCKAILAQHPPCPPSLLEDTIAHEPVRGCDSFPPLLCATLARSGARLIGHPGASSGCLPAEVQLALALKAGWMLMGWMLDANRLMGARGSRPRWRTVHSVLALCVPSQIPSTHTYTCTSTPLPNVFSLFFFLFLSAFIRSFYNLSVGCLSLTAKCIVLFRLKYIRDTPLSASYDVPLAHTPNTLSLLKLAQAASV